MAKSAAAEADPKAPAADDKGAKDKKPEKDTKQEKDAKPEKGKKGEGEKPGEEGETPQGKKSKKKLFIVVLAVVLIGAGAGWYFLNTQKDV